ncbi:MAG TPA: hypothetical protein VFA89_01270 [Terriglobales bacterium]|nr:hypothetical protein [Terriglobales bacterium]
MAQGELLFAKYDLYGVLEGQKQKAKEAVEAINGDGLLNASPEDVCGELEQQFRIDVPALKDLSAEVNQQEANVDVSRDPMRHITDRSRPFYIKGTEVTFFVPFEGDKELFFCQPSSHTLNPPRGEVRNGELVLKYTRLDHDAEAVKREYYADLNSIKQYLDWQRNQAQRFNDELKANIQQWIAARRDRLLKDKGMAAALGIPLRRLADAPKTYAVAAVRKKPSVSRTSSAGKPFKPEPALEMAEYEHILSVISNMVAVMERSPHAFRDMKEEDLRHHFLVQLNGQYEGQASGETFNFEGKTDILIRAEGRNVFVAECKFWRGPESLREAINQLLGYASWRDTKTALLIFNREKNFSNVLAKIPEVIKGHSNFKRQLEYKSETGFRFVLRHKDDPDRELILTVLAFEVPA